MQFRFKRCVVLFGKNGEIQQGIGHAAHRGYDNADTIMTEFEQQIRYAIKTLGVGKTAAAEFMQIPLAVQRKLPQAQNGE